MMQQIYKSPNGLIYRVCVVDGAPCVMQGKRVYLGLADAKNARPAKNFIMRGTDAAGRAIARVFLDGRFAFDNTMWVQSYAG